MKIKIRRASKWTGDPNVEGAFAEGDNYYIEVSTLEELMQIIESNGSDVVMGSKHIMIYDDYIE